MLLLVFRNGPYAIPNPVIPDAGSASSIYFGLMTFDLGPAFGSSNRCWRFLRWGAVGQGLIDGDRAELAFIRAEGGLLAMAVEPDVAPRGVASVSFNSCTEPQH